MPKHLGKPSKKKKCDICQIRGGGSEVSNVTLLKKMLKIHFRPNGAFVVKKNFLVYGGAQPLIFCLLDQNFVKNLSPN